MDLDIRQIELLEEPFRMNRYDGNIESNTYFSYIKGEIPILVSAPHATNHVNKEGGFKLSDAYTGCIAQILHALTGCHLIFLSKQANRNPNYEWNCGYREKLSNVVKEEKIKFILDIHAMSRAREYDIDFGTYKGKSILSEHLNIIHSIFKKNGILDTRENYLFKADYPTITCFCKEVLNVQALQVEIHKKYREPMQSLTEFVQIISALKETINIFK